MGTIGNWVQNELERTSQKGCFWSRTPLNIHRSYSVVPYINNTFQWRLCLKILPVELCQARIAPSHRCRWSTRRGPHTQHRRLSSWFLKRNEGDHGDHKTDTGFRNLEFQTNTLDEKHIDTSVQYACWRGLKWKKKGNLRLQQKVMLSWRRTWGAWINIRANK